MRHLIAIIGASLGLAGIANADTIYVNPGESIQAAINSAATGDTVFINPGTYYESNIHPGVDDITITGALNSNGSLAVTVDAQQQSRVFDCDSKCGEGVLIENLTITGGYATSGNGGGVRISGSNPTISNCIIEYNTARNGCGIYVYLCSPVILDCVIRDNTFVDSPVATGDGGGIACESQGHPTISGCTISGNIARRRGGGIYMWNNSDPSISSCVITGNSAGYGGAIYCGDMCSPVLSMIQVTENVASGDGGGINIDTFSSFTILDSLVCSNAPDQFYGPWNDGGNNEVFEVCPWYQGACCTNGICVVSEEGDCDTFGGSWLGVGTTCDDSPCPSACLGDTDGDGEVNVNDILLVLARWGVTCP